MAKKQTRQEALDYHSKKPPGKLEIVPTKPANSQRDLSLAYSPGVAEPCLEIEKDPESIYRYTAKGNLVAVISNGTAVLGLGNIGAAASKPVMEGKCVLFKIFSGLDGIDLEVDTEDPDDFVKIVKGLEPGFGGINLEDIKSPECFEIEERLKKALNIPVMHDDQHGTAIISAAALINALELAGKKIEDVRVVFNGAGASAIACARIFLSMGVQKKNLIMFDRSGVVHKKRNDLDPYKTQFAIDHVIGSLDEALKGADVFVGLSAGNVLSPEALKSMADDPIVFAMANPDPEIAYETAIATREDVIMATGRSDHPNQVNNVLGFPFIFRGAMDVRATAINEAMKIAAAKALAELARRPVPDIVSMAYNESSLSFGRRYIIPKPVDPRLITTVAPAVAQAAMDSGVARKPIPDMEQYKEELRARIGLGNKLVRMITHKARENPKKVVFAEADNPKILQAAWIAHDEGIAEPILLGNVPRIRMYMEEQGLEIPDVVMMDPFMEEERCRRYGEAFYEKRKRKGYTRWESIKAMLSRNFFGSMMVELGEADALISGITRKYPAVVRPALQAIGVAEGRNRVAGMYIMISRMGPIFIADATVNVDPGTEELVEITEMTAEAVRQFNIEPRIALLSYSNFGSSGDESPRKVSRAVEILTERHPDWILEGEMQANVALNGELLKEYFPFNRLNNQPANTLIFPNLSSGNVAYKLLQSLGAAEAIGPVLLGLDKSVHVLQLGSSVKEIVNMVTIAVVDAQNKSRKQ
jgi:malate dehydrogenase (oxaloacetate-decarboxylating)(NADP+)